MEPRVVVADNAGLFTLEGTRTQLVGVGRVAVIDPGPDLPSHRRALLAALREGDADDVTVLLTHDHPDHAAGLAALVGVLVGEGRNVRVGGSAWGRPATDPVHRGPAPFQVLVEGDQVRTDRGLLRVVETPGHTRDHLAFHWAETNTLFAGDLVLGRGSTAWVGAYAGCVGDYFRSLDRVAALGPDRLVPAHGPPIDEAAEAIARFRRHREERLRAVEEALALDPEVSVGVLVGSIYGPELPGSLRPAAAWSVRALLDHLGARPFPEPGPSGEG